MRRQWNKIVIELSQWTKKILIMIGDQSKVPKITEENKSGVRDSESICFHFFSFHLTYMYRG